MSRPHVAILGAGPAGAGAAWWLRRSGKADVTLIEREPRVGGQTASFDLAGVRVDHGSHRLHPASPPHILEDIRFLLGDDLLDRPRHGRIRLRGRWLHFPLKPFNLATHLPPSFTVGVGLDALSKVLSLSQRNENETFESILLRGLGKTICRDFYFPYARKLWGLPTSELSPIQARRRVSAGSLAKMIRKVLPLPGGRAPAARKGRFFYPREGFGQITTAIASAAQELRANIRLDTTVDQITLADKVGVGVRSEGATTTINADHIWTTLPVTSLVRMIRPTAPSHVMEASGRIHYRGMVLIYLVLDQDQFTPFDAHYFPEETMPLSRLSEPKNYAARTEPKGRTVLCGEWPCRVGDDVWNAGDDELSRRARDALDRCGLPVRSTVLEVLTKRLPCAYPLYKRDYEQQFRIVDDWVEGLDRILTFGRQGLFAHDNTHHALAMAHAAVECLRDDGSFDRDRWSEHRREFESHVVED